MDLSRSSLVQGVFYSAAAGSGPVLHCAASGRAELHAVRHGGWPRGLGLRRGLLPGRRVFFPGTPGGLIQGHFHPKSLNFFISLYFFNDRKEAQNPAHGPQKAWRPVLCPPLEGFSRIDMPEFHRNTLSAYLAYPPLPGPQLHNYLPTRPSIHTRAHTHTHTHPREHIQNMYAHACACNHTPTPTQLASHFSTATLQHPPTNPPAHMHTHPFVVFCQTATIPTSTFSRHAICKSRPPSLLLL